MIVDCPLAAVFAARMRQSRDDLTRQWLARISDRVRLHPNRVFPTDELLDHVPLLIDGVADYLENPARVVTSDVPVMAKAMELGELRYAQGFGEHELLKEYELFGGVLYAFLTRTVDGIDEACSRGELLACAHRLFHAISLIQQATTTQYLSRMKERLYEREERLRAFNRTLTHELRNRIGAALGAAQVLDSVPELVTEERQKLSSVVLRNIGGMQGMLDNLLELSRLGTLDTRQQRHVALPQAVAEAMRQLRDAARDQGVEIRVGNLPAIEVNAAAVELCVSNLLSNAIKYADRSKRTRWVTVEAEAAPPDAIGVCELVVKVSDNGIGVPEAERAHLFERFFRAHTGTEPTIEGTGLGLNIIRETVRSLGGRVWAEFSDAGSTFAFSLPCRRVADRAALAGSASS
jgi:signal transduction histidine kinase